MLYSYYVGTVGYLATREKQRIVGRVDQARQFLYNCCRLLNLHSPTRSLLHEEILQWPQSVGSLQAERPQWN